MVTSSGSRLAALRLVDPHDGGPGHHARIPAADPSAWPATPAPFDLEFAGAGRTWTLAEWQQATHGTSLVLVDHGVVTHEWYAAGLGPRTLFLGASMTKSVLTHLVGRAVHAGQLSVDDRVLDHVPELASSGYAACRVRELLTMTTGVDWVEDHRDPASPASRLLACFLSGAGGSRELLLHVPAGVEPGTRFAYNTADSQVLDWVRESATGTDYAAALTALWAELGAEQDAVVALDAADGVALAGGGVAATARDWARVARLQVDGTTRGPGVRLLDADWVDSASRPSAAYLRPGRLPSSITTHAGFGYAWWPLDDDGRRVTADGSRGQFAYVDRDHDLVVVKTSAWPYDDWLVDRQLRDLSYLALGEISRVAAAGECVATRGDRGQP